jgi:hypothetical protein
MPRAWPHATVACGTAPLGRSRSGRRRSLWPRPGHGRVLATGQQPVADHPECVALHPIHDRVDLDGMDEVVGEEHQQAQAGEKQYERPAHREPGKTSGPAAARHAHRVQPGGAVGESSDEGAQDDLVGPVTQEVTQQPGRKLCGGQLQGHDRQPQQQRDDRHHRASDRDQQGTGVVRSSLERQRRMHPNGDLRQQRADGQSSGHSEGRHHPQRPPGVFSQRVTANHAQLLISRARPPTTSHPRPGLSPALSRRWSQPGMTKGHGKMTRPASAADAQHRRARLRQAPPAPRRRHPPRQTRPHLARHHRRSLNQNLAPRPRPMIYGTRSSPDHGARRAAAARWRGRGPRPGRTVRRKGG